MNKMRFRRGLSCLMALTLLLGLCLPIAGAAEDPSVIHIGSTEDWLQLADHCRLDTWSQGKTVILDCDLDLSGVSPIPTFGGVFDGGGHTVRGFLLTGEGSHQGLFRYVQEGAVVQDLNLRGKIAPDDTTVSIGGIAGSNAGTISRCSFDGLVSGGSSIGGIAGVNEAPGQLVDCSNRSGSVTGSHSAGGIVGSNYGSVLRCSSAAQINTQELQPEVSGVDWDKLNSTENVPACTDTGGVAGYSSGMLQDCTNTGPVGYPHTGYNVGGVAGRQAGYMSGCTNSGLIQGRKEVGGVVGQMEPYTLLQYREDTLQKLSRELDTLNGLLVGALDSTDGTRRQLSAHITALTQHTGDAKEHIFGLLDEVEELGDETVDVVNDLSGRVSRLTSQITPVTEDMQQAADALTRSLKQLEEALDTAGGAGDQLTEADQAFRAALQDMENSVNAIVQLLAKIPVPLDGMNQALVQPNCLHPLPRPDFSGFLATLDDILEHVLDSGSNLRKAFHDLKRAAEALGPVGDILGDTGEELEDALDELSGGSDHLSDAFRDLHKALEEQSDLPTLEFPKLQPEFYEKEDQLSDALTALTDELEGMNQTANQGGDNLSADLRKVNDQFSAITGLLRSARDDQDADRVVDVSDENIASATQGKVQNCRNTGLVDGDVNVGGITGGMSIEYDFDPEDDVTDQGDTSLNFQYLTRVILQDCVNRGTVQGRKDCTGGMVGRMELGVVLDCESYGSVESTGGKYIGGIAGLSRGVIRDCWVKCSLTGSRNVGGVAGLGADVRDCRTLVQINDAVSCFGAVTGEPSSDGLLSGNFFVSDTLGGVDGISYSGKAAPMAYETFMAQPGIPREFQNLTLTFTYDGNVLDTLEVPYGSALTDEQLPSVPQRDGFYGSWSFFERDRVVADAEIEAVYVPLLTTVSSPDGSVLAEGVFTPDAALTVTDSQHDSPDVAQEYIIGQYIVQLSEGEDDFTALRMALPKDCKKARLWVLDDSDQWNEVPAERDGSFLRAELTGSSAHVCLVQAASYTASLWTAAGAAALVLTVGLFLHFRSKRKKKPNGRSTSSPSEKVEK